MPWYLIETLCPEPSASIVFTDGHQRDWASLRMVQRSDGISGIDELVAQVRRTGDELDQTVSGRMGPRRVVMQPAPLHKRANSVEVEITPCQHLELRRVYVEQLITRCGVASSLI